MQLFHDVEDDQNAGNFSEVQCASRQLGGWAILMAMTVLPILFTGRITGSGLQFVFHVVAYLHLQLKLVHDVSSSHVDSLFVAMLVKIQVVPLSCSLLGCKIELYIKSQLALFCFYLAQNRSNWRKRNETNVLNECSYAPT